jgi:hypothetical protein
VISPSRSLLPFATLGSGIAAKPGRNYVFPVKRLHLALESVTELPLILQTARKGGQRDDGLVYGDGKSDPSPDLAPQPAPKKERNNGSMHTPLAELAGISSEMDV